MTAETVVVGVDGSSCADAALEWALGYARGRDAVVHVVTAWNWEVVGLPGARFPTESREDGEQRARRTIEAALDRQSPALREEVTVRPVPVQGPASRVLLDAAVDAGLLVVGSRGLGGFSGLLLGSVSHQCVLHAPCPVVVVRGPDGG